MSKAWDIFVSQSWDYPPGRAWDLSHCMEIKLSKDMYGPQTQRDTSGRKHKAHKQTITHGVVGEWSKVKEELEEADDAYNQGLFPMHIWELGDMLGALELYLKKHHPSITVENLLDQGRHTNKLRG